MTKRRLDEREPGTVRGVWGGCLPLAERIERDDPMAWSRAQPGAESAQVALEAAAVTTGARSYMRPPQGEQCSTSIPKLRINSLVALDHSK